MDSRRYLTCDKHPFNSTDIRTERWVLSSNVISVVHYYSKCWIIIPKLKSRLKQIWFHKKMLRILLEKRIIFQEIGKRSILLLRVRKIPVQFLGRITSKGDLENLTFTWHTEVKRGRMTQRLTSTDDGICIGRHNKGHN